MLGVALGYAEQSEQPNDTRFCIVISLIIHSLRAAGALKFLVVVMEAFDLDIDEVAASPANGTPLLWFVKSPRLAVFSSQESTGSK